MQILQQLKIRQCFFIYFQFLLFLLVLLRIFLLSIKKDAKVCMNKRIINFEHSIFNVQIKNDLIPSGIEFTCFFFKNTSNRLVI